MSDDLLTQAVAVYVGVDFRCPDAFMTQHTLDCPQVGPASSRCVAKECRKVCGLIVFLMPAIPASSLMIWNTMMREMFLPNRLMNTKSSYPGLISPAFRSGK